MSVYPSSIFSAYLRVSLFSQPISIFPFSGPINSTHLHLCLNIPCSYLSVSVLWSHLCIYLSSSIFSAYLRVSLFSQPISIFPFSGPINSTHLHLCLNIPWSYLSVSVLWSHLCIYLSAYLHFCISALLCICSPFSGTINIPSVQQIDFTCTYAVVNIPISGFSITHRLNIKASPDCMSPRDPKICDDKIEALLDRGFAFIWTSPVIPVGRAD